MAKSTRQYVFEGMELLPAALIPFVEKRLETSLKGHWQVQVLEKLPGLRPNSNGEVGWDHFQYGGERPGLLHVFGVQDQPLPRFSAALNLVAAELVDRLWRQAQVGHDRNTRAGE